MQMFLSIALWIIIGAASAYYAQLRGRDPISWFVLGMLLGVIAPIILYFIPSLEQKVVPDETLASTPPPTDPAERQSVRFRNWFYLDASHTQQGPVTFLYLQRLIDQGVLEGSSLVWSEGMESWSPLETIPDLKEALHS